MRKSESLFLFCVAWLIVFPFACFLGVASVAPVYTMGGRYQGWVISGGGLLLSLLSLCTTLIITIAYLYPRPRS